MPGILPMKVIKVGTSSQGRIAQACDRCRSKKIRCDGIRPCTQCANVGFECRTSDKLSRRAFPRGYTESLEERVRILEGEIHELKDLLDKKDEKLEMLSKIQGHRQTSMKPSPKITVPSIKKELPFPAPAPREDTFRPQASPLLLGAENSDSYFMGSSSGWAFIEAFKRKMKENGEPCSDFFPELFLHIQGCIPVTREPTTQKLRVPPRLFSDRCVNVYFQEWNPLFPVLHKPTFLRTYEEFVLEPDKVKNNHELAQLHLVFSIAVVSREEAHVQQLAACELQWERALDAILLDNTMTTLQCLILALMYCSIRADYKRLQHYKEIAVGLSHRLGLHQSQKRFSSGVLTIETRKKVFWTLYTIDCLSAAMLGLPRLLKDNDSYAEYPSDTDDEYVTEQGFQPCLPGEHTRISGALALFRGSRILAKVLEKNYSAATSHELSLQQMALLGAELDEWLNKLPPHLKLKFKQDKPSADITGSRSPLLSLTYYFIRMLIYRPAVGSPLGQRATPALMLVSESGKHIVQIIQLLEERSMSFSFTLNKTDVLTLCCMALLYQNLELKQDSKLLKDNERVVNSLVKILDRTKAQGLPELKRLVGRLMVLDTSPTVSPLLIPQPSQACQHTDARQNPHLSTLASPRKEQRVLNSSGKHDSVNRSETDARPRQGKPSRVEITPPVHRCRSYSGLSQTPLGSSRQTGLQLNTTSVQAALMTRVSFPGQSSHHLRHGSPTSSHSQPSGQNILPAQERRQQQLDTKALVVGAAAEWDTLLTQMDRGPVTMYNAMYGGSAAAVPATMAQATGTTAWPPDSWDLSGYCLDDLAGRSAVSLTLSEDGLSSSADELASSEMGLSTTGSLDFHGSLISIGGGYLEGMNIRYGL